MRSARVIGLRTRASATCLRQALVGGIPQRQDPLVLPGVQLGDLIHDHEGVVVDVLVERESGVAACHLALAHPTGQLCLRQGEEHATVLVQSVLYASVGHGTLAAAWRACAHADLVRTLDLLAQSVGFRLSLSLLHLQDLVYEAGDLALEARLLHVPDWRGRGRGPGVR